MMNDTTVLRCAVSPSVASNLSRLAEQLRDGPLRVLAALQHEATLLANRIPDNDHELLEQLQVLVVLSISGMSRFQEFTTGLRELMDRVAAERIERH